MDENHNVANRRPSGTGLAAALTPVTPVVCSCSANKVPSAALRPRVFFDFVRFGADLKAYREDRGLGLSYKLTEESGVDAATHSRMEKRQRSNQRIQTVVRLADWAGLTIEDYAYRARR